MFKEIKFEENNVKKKDSLQKYLSSQVMEMITQAKEDELLVKKQEFFNWLEVNYLNHLLNIKTEKTSFEWKCLMDILNIFMQFDSLIEQHDKVFGKPIDRINEVLRERMTLFSEEYDSDEIIDECCQDKLPKILRQELE